MKKKFSWVNPWIVIVVCILRAFIFTRLLCTQFGIGEKEKSHTLLCPYLITIKKGKSIAPYLRALRERHTKALIWKVTFQVLRRTMLMMEKNDKKMEYKKALRWQTCIRPYCCIEEERKRRKVCTWHSIFSSINIAHHHQHHRHHQDECLFMCNSIAKRSMQACLGFIIPPPPCQAPPSPLPLPERTFF